MILASCHSKSRGSSKLECARSNTSKRASITAKQALTVSGTKNISIYSFEEAPMSAFDPKRTLRIQWLERAGVFCERGFIRLFKQSGIVFRTRFAITISP